MKEPCATCRGARRGFALLQVLMAILLIVSLLGVGAMLVGPYVRRNKINDTRDIINAAFDSVVSWAQANKRLPCAANDNVSAVCASAGDEFSTVARNPNDSFGRPLIYIYDSNLTDTSTGGLCGRSSTQLSVGNTSNVAIVILSGGDDYAFQTTLTGNLNGVAKTGYTLAAGDSGSVSVTSSVSPQGNDITRVVTLQELRNRAGCFGRTAGGMKIINRMLPAGFINAAYNTTLYAEGGAPFSGSGSYNWCVEVNNRDSVPNELQFSPNVVRFPNSSASPTTCAGSAWGRADAMTLSGLPKEPGIFSLTFYAGDNNNNIFSRSFPLQIGKSAYSTISYTPPGSQVSTADNSGSFVTVTSSGDSPAANINTTTGTISVGSDIGGGAGTYGCIWYPGSFQLMGKTMRAYFEYRFVNIDTSNNSNAWGYGLTFTVMTADNNTTVQPYVCGGTDSDEGYDGHSPFTPIPGKSVAVEYDILPDTGVGKKNDPSNNHMAILQNGSNYHPASGPLSCPGPACYVTPRNPVTGINWMEDNLTHRARVELQTMCDSACANCGVSGNTYAFIKAWNDCASCDNLTADYTLISPLVSYCFVLDPTMNNVKVGFTEGTSGGITQFAVLSSFGISFY